MNGSIRKIVAPDVAGKILRQIMPGGQARIDDDLRVIVIDELEPKCVGISKSR